jgi:hypothetical protein
MNAMNTPAASTLADRFELLIERLGLSKRGFARRCGIVESHFHHIIRKNSAREDTLLKVSRATGCSLRWLQDGVGEPFDADTADVFSGAASVAAYARVLGIPAEITQAVVETAAPGIDPRDLLARMQVAEEIQRLLDSRPGVALYEAAAAFARASGVSTEAIVKVRELALSGGMASADEIFREMVEAERLLIPGAAAAEEQAKSATKRVREMLPKKPAVTNDELAALGYRK